MSQETYNVLFLVSHWLFAFFALMLLLFALVWHHSDQRERRKRFKNLPGAGTVGELVVLSGSKELPPDTWFPVPREGVLGSLRTCDLVVPCPGVRSLHLDFSWQDGTGLLVRPRAGCDVLVDGIPVSRRGAYADVPLVHGSLLQVGSAVLRLNLFSALSHTNQAFTPQAPVSEPGTGTWAPPPAPSSMPAPYTDPRMPQAPQNQGAFPARPLPPPPAAEQLPPDRIEPPRDSRPYPGQPGYPQDAQRPGPADRWKEDWSE